MVYKYGAYVPVSQELLDVLTEPTPEQLVEYQQRRAERKAETSAWLHDIADHITNPVALTVLNLHQNDEGYCTECIDDTMALPWPCRTVRVVVDHLGFPAPDWCEFD